MRLKTGVGETLRSKREELGYSFEHIENETKIRAKFIEALENEDYKTIPGEAYVKGFLKAYAELLGLSGDEVLLAYKGQTSQAADAPEILENTPNTMPPSPTQKASEKDVRFSTRVASGEKAPELQDRKELEIREVNNKPIGFSEHRTEAYSKSSISNKKRRGNENPKKHKSSLIMALLLAVAIGGTGYLSWRYMSSGNDEAASIPPVKKQDTQPQDTQSSILIDDQTNSKNATQAGVVDAQATESAVQSSGKLEMTLQIVGTPCWASVKADGKTIVSKTLEAGAEIKWTANEVTDVKLGNAGAAKITLNGTDIGTLGANGSIYKKEFLANSGGLN